MDLGPPQSHIYNSTKTVQRVERERKVQGEGKIDRETYRETDKKQRGTQRETCRHTDTSMQRELASDLSPAVSG